MSTDVSDAMQDLIRLRRLHEIVSLDYRRGLRAVANSGVSQREIAQRLRVTQPTISAVLRKAQDLPPGRRGILGRRTRRDLPALCSRPDQPRPAD